ncbi:hypothetical protein GCM10010402_13350 [Actinomadura luteofluorescens]|uniref:hypothetical protein n=1 Tax=Actinomadura luteofluorescens TaxID=46163 RepID=UPI002164DB19|nr:hypothetical protein [Actinomadura glauciflava]MCR3745358.1 hypothetical protein [Actinomadura glauciflava]
MITSPTDSWRELGTFPDVFLERVEQALRAFEAELTALGTPTDQAVMAAVEHVVVALNQIDGTGGHDFDTVDREELCEYIEDALTRTGVDVEALARRRGIDPAALTDEWRDW